MRCLNQFLMFSDSRWFQRSVVIVLALTMPFLLVEGSSSDASAKQIRQSSEIPVIAAGQQGGQYQTDYFTVNYSYTRVGDKFNISGTVQFSDMVQQNWNIVQTFYLGLVFADSQGNVLKEHGLSTPGYVNLDMEAPVKFRNSFAVPAGAAYMAFKATGQAIGDGPGNDATPFWVDPIKGVNW